MFGKHITKRKNRVFKFFSLILSVIFITTTAVPVPLAHAQNIAPQVFNLPPVGMMIPLSSSFEPAVVRGITIYPDEPFKFDFFVDKGKSKFDKQQLKEESTKLIKYFLASLTTPDEDLWVNLSPYEKERIIAPGFGRTEMGRDLLAQDYMLKQLTASLMYPEKDLGKDFWDRVYKKVRQRQIAAGEISPNSNEFGGLRSRINTFNKIWIVPDKATVYEKDNSAFVVETHLKVMLEEDYEAMRHQKGMAESQAPSWDVARKEVVSGVSSEVIKDILIPEIEKEVNEGRTFSNLRQIYHSMILATWYKLKLKNSILSQVYVNKNKTKGVNVDDEQINQKIYQQYLDAFKKGVFDLTKEDYDPNTQEVVSRKYFSGGTDFSRLNKIITGTLIFAASFSSLSVDAQNKLKSDSLVKVNMKGVPVGSKFDEKVELAAYLQNADSIPIKQDSLDIYNLTEKRINDLVERGWKKGKAFMSDKLLPEEKILEKIKKFNMQPNAINKNIYNIPLNKQYIDMPDGYYDPFVLPIGIQELKNNDVRAYIPIYPKPPSEKAVDNPKVDKALASIKRSLKMLGLFYLMMQLDGQVEKKGNSVPVAQTVQMNPDNQTKQKVFLIGHKHSPPGLDEEFLKTTAAVLMALVDSAISDEDELTIIVQYNSYLNSLLKKYRPTIDQYREEISYMKKLLGDKGNKIRYIGLERSGAKDSKIMMAAFKKTVEDKFTEMGLNDPVQTADDLMLLFWGPASYMDSGNDPALKDITIVPLEDEELSGEEEARAFDKLMRSFTALTSHEESKILSDMILSIDSTGDGLTEEDGRHIMQYVSQLYDGSRKNDAEKLVEKIIAAYNIAMAIVDTRNENIVKNIDSLQVNGGIIVLYGSAHISGIKALLSQNHQELIKTISFDKDLQPDSSAGDSKPAESNKAVIKAKDKYVTYGGINLNPKMLGLDLKTDGKGVILPMNQQPLLNLKIEGIIPIIINIRPMHNLPLQLGLIDKKDNPSQKSARRHDTPRLARWEV